MNENITMKEILEKYPQNMMPKDVAEFLNVSLSTVYNLIKQNDFPVLTMPGGRIHLIPKHKFILWYLQQIEKEPINHKYMERIEGQDIGILTGQE